MTFNCLLRLLTINCDLLLLVAILTYYCQLQQSIPERPLAVNCDDKLSIPTNSRQLRIRTGKFDLWKSGNLEIWNLCFISRYRYLQVEIATYYSQLRLPWNCDFLQWFATQFWHKFQVWLTGNCEEFPEPWVK